MKRVKSTAAVRIFPLKCLKQEHDDIHEKNKFKYLKSHCLISFTCSKQTELGETEMFWQCGQPVSLHVWPQFDPSMPKMTLLHGAPRLVITPNIWEALGYVYDRISLSTNGESEVRLDATLRRRNARKNIMTLNSRGLSNGGYFKIWSASDLQKKTTQMQIKLPGYIFNITIRRDK